MIRLSWWNAAAALVVVAGGLAFVRGAVPQSAASTGGAASNSPPIVVSGAYIRVPASPDLAAVYMTIYNTTAAPDTLTSVIPGFGEEATIHAEVDGSMQGTPNGLVVPAHGSVVLKPSTGHVMVQNLYGTLTAGQSVNVELDFSRAGPVLVTVPVIGIYDPVPAGAAK